MILITSMCIKNIYHLCIISIYNICCFFYFSNIDNNPEYDDLHTETIDEEDKYFDSESPREKSESQKVEEEVPNVELKNNSEEDELDVYMNTLIKNEITDSDADKFKK